MIQTNKFNIMKHENITEMIIGCAFKVHSFLGNGFQEVIYQRALAIEFREIGLDFVREKSKIYIIKITHFLLDKKSRFPC